MAPGEYAGEVIVTAKVPGAKPQVFPVTLTIWAPMSLAVWPVELSSLIGGPVTSYPMTLVPNSVVPVSVRVEMDGAGRWLSATIPNSTTSTSIELKADPSGLPVGKFQGRVIVTGPVNTATIPVTLTVLTPEPTTARFQPAALTFSLEAGERAFITAIFASINPAPFRGPPIGLSSTASWLILDTPVANAIGGFSARVEARSLAPGVYIAAIKATLPYGLQVVEMPVQLRVWGNDSPTSVIRVEPAALQLTGQTATLKVISEGVPEAVEASVETPAEGCRLSVHVVRDLLPQVITPAEVTVSCAGPPGRYAGSVRVTAGNRTVIVPVSVVIPPVAYTGLVSPPLISAVTNAASNAMGPVAAGEVVTIHGIGQGRKVTFDGLPATILYESLYQTNVLVPAGVAGKDRVAVQVTGGGSATATVPVVAAAPAIFTIDGTGRGQGAILNQDNVINSAEHPAAAGEVVQIFATGAVAPVKVTIGGKEAQILFAGLVPQAGIGLFQVNALVPAGLSGNAAIVLQATGVESQSGVTLAVY